MKLEQLTKETEGFLLGKTIYCYEKNAGYMSELKVKYPAVFANIKAIVEPNERYQQPVLGIETVGPEELKSIKVETTAIIITSDYFEEAFERLSSLKVLLPEIIYYFLNEESELEFFYRAKYEMLPLKNQIVFRSGPHASSYVKGTDYADNARAVFEYMVAKGLNEKFRLVWFVKNPDEFSDIKSEYNNVEFLSFDWNDVAEPTLMEKYYEALYTSKYILFTDAYGFARNCRKEQVRIQLWHGCGFKTRTNFVPCENRYEYNIVISDLYKKIHADIYGLRDDQVIVTGYPKADWLFHPVQEKKLQQLGIKKASKYIFWLPTFRKAKAQLSELNEGFEGGDTGLPMITSMADMQEINEMLKAADAIMVIKLHPFQDETIVKAENLSNIQIIKNADLADAGVQINQLLGHASALITDYSSVATEFMLLNRPIGFTLDDVEEYENSRGFVFENIKDYLPGKEIFYPKDFSGFVAEVLAGIDSTYEKRQCLTKKMHKFQDGESCRRFVEYFFR